MKVLTSESMKNLDIQKLEQLRQMGMPTSTSVEVENHQGIRHAARMCSNIKNVPASGKQETTLSLADIIKEPQLFCSHCFHKIAVSGSSLGEILNITRNLLDFEWAYKEAQSKTLQCDWIASIYQLVYVRYFASGLDKEFLAWVTQKKAEQLLRFETMLAQRKDEYAQELLKMAEEEWRIEAFVKGDKEPSPPSGGYLLVKIQQPALGQAALVGTFGRLAWIVETDGVPEKTLGQRSLIYKSFYFFSEQVELEEKLSQEVIEAVEVLLKDGGIYSNLETALKAAKAI